MKAIRMFGAGLVTLTCLIGATTSDGEPLQSPRLERAKDYIAEERWERAIEELKAAAADAKERHRDEALFWLAHSQHQGRDLAAAVQTIAALERQFPASRWVKPARSLRVEIAQTLRRSDVLWMTAQPALAPPSPSPAGAPPTPAPAPAPGKPPSAPMPFPPEVPPAAATPAVPPRTRVMTAPPPLAVWLPQGSEPDTNLRIQALGSLIQTDAPRVIPILKEIALNSPDASEAGRAVFVLAQSGRPEAHSTVLEVARSGSELVQIAAVKELGRFGGPNVADQLLQVYRSANPRVKYQVVNSLGERSATTALLRIAETEANRRLRESAIIRLGQAGAREQLQRFYTRANADLKRPIIIGLFNARADDELIRIAERESNPEIRREALMRLRLLGTDKARAYLEKRQQKR